MVTHEHEQPILKSSVRFETLAEGRIGDYFSICCLTVEICEDNQIELASPGYEGIALACDYVIRDEDGYATGEFDLPAEIGGTPVKCVDGEYVLGDRLVRNDQDPNEVIRLNLGQVKEAHEWIRNQGWSRSVQDFEQVWARIVWIVLTGELSIALGEHILSGNTDHLPYQLFCGRPSPTELRLVAVFTDAEAPAIRVFCLDSRASLETAIIELNLSLREFLVALQEAAPPLFSECTALA